uniref:Putative secreted protein n=1 Tax=Anopheles darlingi TaxID=43151 RepID=A0A2M4DEM9_ANODA
MARLSLCCCSMLASVARRIALISDMRLISRINSSSGRSRINSVSGRPVRRSRHSFATMKSNSVFGSTTMLRH